MSIINEKFTISTRGFDDIIDITPKVQGILSQSGVLNALVNVSVIGSTASIVTLEYEPGLVVDLPEVLNSIVPVNRVYEHDNTWHDSNGYAHLRASILSNGVNIPAISGKLELGTWQQIVLVDFDNKNRVREIVVSIVY